MDGWTAEITNNPERDFELYVELLEDGRNVGRLEYADDGALVLTCYESATVPWKWLAGVVDWFLESPPPPRTPE